MALDVIITPGVRDLPQAIELMKAMEQFDTLNEDNDPYGEHDFGSLECMTKKVFWKIDYYEQKLEYGEESLLPDCRQVMTVSMDKLWSIN